MRFGNLILPYWVFRSCIAPRSIWPAGPPCFARIHSRLPDPAGSRTGRAYLISRERLRLPPIALPLGLFVAFGR